MGFMLFGLAVLIIALTLSYGLKILRPRHQWAKRRPLGRAPVENIYPDRGCDPLQAFVEKPCGKDSENRLPPQVEYEAIEEPDVDIVAVHGLGSDADWSWTWQQEGEQSVEWLKDPNMLPKMVKRARILRYNYHSRWDVNAPDICLEACGRTLIRRIHNFRADKRDRPLIFVGHSLGGLVIEYGLLWADSDPEFRYFVHHTIGCIFLGCPFMGSKMQILARAAAFILSPFGSQIGIIEKISYENDDLFEKLSEFCKLTRRAFLPVSCFYETYNTDYGRKIRIPFIFSGRVVNKFSASIQTGKILPLDTNHLQLNKFCGPNDRSFIDVAAEIMEMYQNRDMLLRRRRTYWHESHLMVPFGRNESFFGRESILQLLSKRIPPDAAIDTCQRLALEGLGGVGKTQIAIEAIYRLHHRDPSCSIFWVPAFTSDAFEDAYHDIGRKLGVSSDVDRGDAMLLVKTALENADMGRCLLVIDGADDEKFLGDGVSFADYLPFNRTGSILFTSRNRHAVIGLRAACIHVDPMNEAEAMQLLSSGSLDLSLVEGENANSTETLLNLLTSLPLAIQQASNYLNKNQIPSTEYVQIYQSSHDEMVYLLSWAFEAHGRYEGAENAIVTTYFTSFRQLQQSDSLAADFLRAMSFLGDHEFPREMLPLDSGLRRVNEAVGKLAAFTFVRRRDIGQFVYYDFHRLVQTSARAWIRKNNRTGRLEWKDFGERALARLEDMFPLPAHAK